jgi:hypothetical protein
MTSLVRGVVENLLFSSIKKLVIGLGIPLRYLSGGSGRSYNFIDTVILDIYVPQAVEIRKNCQKRFMETGKLKDHGSG